MEESALLGECMAALGQHRLSDQFCCTLQDRHHLEGSSHPSHLWQPHRQYLVRLERLWAVSGAEQPPNDLTAGVLDEAHMTHSM